METRSRVRDRLSDREIVLLCKLPVRMGGNPPISVLVCIGPQHSNLLPYVVVWPCDNWECIGWGCMWTL